MDSWSFSYTIDNLIYDAKNWLNHREYKKYSFTNRSNYLLSIILGFIISIIVFIIIYSNVEKLNEIKIWIIKIGGVLLLISLFFVIKYSYKVLKEGVNLLKRQKNWIKYLIFIVLLILLWQAYTHKDTVLNPVLDIYNNTNFSLFAPISIGNFSWDEDFASFNYVDSEGKNKEIVIPTSTRGRLDESQIESKIHNLINQQRSNNGLSSLNYDTGLADRARKHSQRMVDEDFFEHDNLIGKEMGENINYVPTGDVIGCGCYQEKVLKKKR